VIAEAEIVALDAKAKHRHIAGPPVIHTIPPRVEKDSTTKREIALTMMPRPSQQQHQLAFSFSTV
jgi:hypothetical protein